VITRVTVVAGAGAGEEMSLTEGSPDRHGHAPVSRGWVQLAPRGIRQGGAYPEGAVRGQLR
jgi:hypothetical protein